MESAAQVVILAIASFVVLASWIAACVLFVLFLNRRVARLERENPGVEPEDSELAFLFYALSLFFWPAALLLGIHFMSKVETVRIGRVCAILGLVDVSVIVLLTCAGLVILAAVAPDLLPHRL